MPQPAERYAVQPPLPPPAPVRIPRWLDAPEPGWTTAADVIVVGTGIAGLTAALRLREQVDTVLLVTKTVLTEGSTSWAQGGIAAAMDPADSPEEHLHDTLVQDLLACLAAAQRRSAEDGDPVR